MKKKLSPIAVVILLLLALFFGIPGNDTPADAPAPSQALEDFTQSVQISPEITQPPTTEAAVTEPLLDIHGSYTTKEDVALYIHIYGCLPDNFMTKSQARSLGWEGGSLEPYAPGMCIGGDRFGNYEGLLPAGHTYIECDIDTLGGGSRGAKRIVFSTDGLIYYTDDHYETFELLYGEE